MIMRRVERRLSMCDELELEAYAQRLHDDSLELDALYHDLLIGVTTFFRDEEAWTGLEDTLLPGLIDRLDAGKELRAWVVATATGEEAYSLAILLTEMFEARGRQPRFRIFATDVHEKSLAYASTGLYPADRLTDVSTERLEHFFTKRPEGHQVAPDIRKTVVFACHNVIRDAPFTNLDLITCRNLFIYFKPPVQRKVLTLFHFGLKMNSGLWLGASETPGELDEEFEAVDEHLRLYRKRRDVRLSTSMRQPASAPKSLKRPEGATGNAPPTPTQILTVYDQLLAEYMPPGLLLHETGELLHVFGDGHKFLEVPTGRVSGMAADLVSGDVRVALLSGIQKAIRERLPVVFSDIRSNALDDGMDLRLTVRPVNLGRTEGRRLLVQFQTAERKLQQPHQSVDAAIPIDPLSLEELESLQTELQYTKESLHATIQELQTANEEMQSTNEELVASNEELQSTNEELHSVNEELYTVNAEHQRKITELTELTDDMDNLLNCTNVHTVFLDRELRLRRFTPGAARTFNLIPEDTGRRIDSFTHNIQYRRRRYY